MKQSELIIPFNAHSVLRIPKLKLTVVEQTILIYAATMDCPMFVLFHLLTAYVKSRLVHGKNSTAS